MSRGRKWVGEKLTAIGNTFCGARKTDCKNGSWSLKKAVSWWVLNTRLGVGGGKETLLESKKKALCYETKAGETETLRTVGCLQPVKTSLGSGKLLQRFLHPKDRNRLTRGKVFPK